MRIPSGVVEICARLSINHRLTTTEATTVAAAGMVVAVAVVVVMRLLSLAIAFIAITSVGAVHDVGVDAHTNLQLVDVIHDVLRYVSQTIVDERDQNFVD